LGSLHTRNLLQVIIQKRYEVFAVPAKDLREQIEFARRLDEVRHLRQLRDGLGHLINPVGLDLDADDASLIPTQLVWLGNGNDLHDPRVDQPLHPTSHCPL